MEEKLPPGVNSVAPEIGLKEVRGKFVENFLKKTIPKNDLEGSTLGVHSFSLEPSVSKIERKKNPRKKNNLDREKKKCVYKIAKDGLKFSEFYPIHSLWKQYMDQVLGETSDNNQLYAKLVRADYHGCYMVVADSNCATLRGQRGLVVQETRNTFKLLTHKDKIVIIPKKKNIFAFEFKGKLIKLYGTNFCFQASERMKIKFKPKPLDKL